MDGELEPLVYKIGIAVKSTGQISWFELYGSPTVVRNSHTEAEDTDFLQRGV